MKISLKIFMVIAFTVLLSQTVMAKKVSTNLVGKFTNSREIPEKLTAAGFTVLGRYAVMSNFKYKLLVITHKDLRKYARKDKRGFVAVLRVLINMKKKEVLVTNPEYFMHAFLQKSYKSGSEVNILAALKKALGDLKPSSDKLSSGSLGDYHFMLGMPYYQEFQTVGKGNEKDLLQKIKDSKRLKFNLDLSSGGKTRYLVGVMLPRKIEAFTRKLGIMNKASLLPYMVLIESGKAKIMHAKYFLAISLPNLSMGQFMKISSIPDDIFKSIKKIFK